MDKREILERKILGQEELERMLAFWRFKDKSVSLAYGTFDVLKPGSIEMIIQAANKANVLLVAVKSDDLVAKQKGAGNPLNHQCNRAMALAAQMLVSGVYIVGSEDPSALVELVKPAVIVHCKNSTEKEISAFKKIIEREGEVLEVDTSTAIEQKTNSQCCCE